MKRRTILKQLGTAAATTAFVGTAAAQSGPTIDVSHVSGTVRLADVLDGEELAGLDVDPRDLYFNVDEETDEITPMDNTCECTVTCDTMWKIPDCPHYCGCCECEQSNP